MEYLEFYNLCKKSGVLSFRHRFCCFIIFSRYHEMWLKNKTEDKTSYKYDHSDIGPMELIEKIPGNFLSLDTFDTIYCLNYIIKSYDFNEALKDKIDQIRVSLKEIRTGNHMKDTSTYFDEIEYILVILKDEFINGKFYVN